jgi:hypothetical protein
LTLNLIESSALRARNDLIECRISCHTYHELIERFDWTVKEDVRARLVTETVLKQAEGVGF